MPPGGTCEHALQLQLYLSCLLQDFRLEILCHKASCAPRQEQAICETITKTSKDLDESISNLILGMRSLSEGFFKEVSSAKPPAKRSHLRQCGADV